MFGWSRRATIPPFRTGAHQNMVIRVPQAVAHCGAVQEACSDEKSEDVTTDVLACGMAENVR